MSNDTTTTIKPAGSQPPAPETQKQRWVKYGANVVLSTIVVVLLAAAIIYLAQMQRFERRIDTTAAGIYSLKPQTVNLIKDLKQKVRLVSLYSAKDAQQQDNPYAGPVRDLLEEYARKSPNVEFEFIDPITQPSKTDALVSEAVAKYGGAVQAYKDFLTDFQKTTFQQLSELTSAEAAAVANVPTDNLGTDERSQTIAAVVDTIRDQIPQTLTRLKERTERSLKPKFPQYKDIVDRVRESLESLSETEAAIIKFAGQLQADQKLPEALKQYLADSTARHETIKKLADDTVKKIEGLGELKVGELQQAIKGQDLILVLGEKDWRVINPEQVWVTDTRDIRGFTEGQQEIKPRFAGEQAVTTAILSVSSGTKPKVAFVRPGGPPLTTPGFPPFQRGGPLSDVAERLRGYNFDVVEKDITGMWAMQSQMQGMPPAPEPSDEEIKDALWIVVDAPSDQRMGPAPSVAPKLAEHLANGGSAMVLAMVEADNLSEALKDYGVELVTDAVIVHEVPPGERARSSDLAEEAQRLPFVFVVNKYGEHPLTAPLRSLDTLLVGVVPVKTSAAPDAKQTPLLPIPQNTKVWGERNIESASGENLKFDETGAMADVPPPLFAGAAAEKGGSRIVVFGGLQSFTNQILSIPDQEMLRRRIVVSRFPGNSELFTNAVFWLAKMEPMIAISPAAMEVSRISDMSDAALAGWRVGVLLILLPGLVLAAGIAMYFARRD